MEKEYLHYKNECPKCGEKIYRCDGCSNKFQGGDYIYCVNTGEGTKHYCTRCIKLVYLEYKSDEVIK